MTTVSATCPRPMFSNNNLCCLSMYHDYNSSATSFAKNCLKPALVKDLYCCITQTDINYTIQAYMDINGTQHISYMGPFEGEIVKRTHIDPINTANNTKLLQLISTKTTTPKQVKDYDIPLTKPTEQSNGNMIIIVIIVVFLIILAIAWKLGKEDENEKDK